MSCINLVKQMISELNNYEQDQEQILQREYYLEACKFKKYYKVADRFNGSGLPGQVRWFIDKETGDILEPYDERHPSKKKQGNLFDSINPFFQSDDDIAYHFDKQSREQSILRRQQLYSY